MTWRLKDAGMAVDLAAAGMFAAATGFAASALLGGTATMLAAPAFVLALGGLRRVDSGSCHGLPDFALAPVETPGDLAVEPGDDTVVRLFDPRQLAIARPSAQSEGRAGADAGQALSDALAQLKRSLR